ncbi:MAG: hypothetical protein IT271_05335 [Chitinophagales bacterium]|nr:hypothetical protein [Chitinophagales bacterium]
MWQKKGLLFDAKKHKNEQLISHGSIPFAVHLQDDAFRIYFSSRDKTGKSFPYYIDAIINNGNITLTGEVCGPVLQLGELGTFDDSGIMPSCLVKENGFIYMYYIGWNPQVTVSYRLSIGLAISKDNGVTFKKYSNGPVCDRSIDEPFFNTAPYVILEDGKWKMWYISCTQWQIINNYPEPSYHIKYAESGDGIYWEKRGIVCIDYDEKAKAIGRPCVIKQGDEYKLYFSYRDIYEYRTSPKHGYKIGLANSTDGINWNKQYDQTNIYLSENGWDSNMMEYCHVFNHSGIEYMLYNGNDFGKDGFGYAVNI